MTYDEAASIVRDTIRPCAMSLAVVLYQRRLSACDEDEVVYSIGLADTYFYVFLRDHAPHMPFNRGLLPGAEALAKQCCPLLDAAGELLAMRERLLDSYKTYEEIMLATFHWPRLPVGKLPALFTGIACDLVQAAARNHGRIAPDVNDNDFDNAITGVLDQQLVLLASRLKIGPYGSPAYAGQPRPASSRQVPQGEAFIPPRKQSSNAGKYMLLAVLAVVILWLISR